MAPLPDLSAHRFARRLDVVQQAFITASIALKELVEEQRRVLAEYEAEVAAGLEPIEARDEDGHLLWTQDQLLQLHIEDAAEALQSLHKATVISAYHVWEDASRRFTEAPEDATHSDLVKALKKRKVKTHTGLAWVSHLVNTLKHGSASRGRKLRSQKPRLFRPNFKPDAGRVDWYDAVVLSSDVVEEVITIVCQSGPTAH
jgi:hypothetical protein